jgi:cyclopropane-fatty-acyl-phospholipid synthase
VTLAGAAARRLVFRALRGLRGGELVLRYPDGRGRRFGDGLGPRAVVDLHRPDLFWNRLARRTSVGLGESYVDGDWDADDLVALFELVSRNLPQLARHPWVSRLQRLQALRPHHFERQTPAAARRSIHAHYDLGNDLFRLMLDSTMTYSCAYWQGPEMTLEEAQVAKYRAICDKLQLTPDDHVLEIGCGWGGFAIHAASEHGCRVTAVTISQAQAELARERVAEAALEDLVEVREQDYRRVEGRFSRIASIEMFEAIGLAEHAAFFAAVDRLLEPGGVVVLQMIAMPDHRFERYRHKRDWVQQYVFPGSLIPSLAAVSRAVAGSTLMIVGLEEIGISYAETLKAWRENVDRNASVLRSLGYDERFLRTWRFYLCYCEAAFRVRHLRDMQLVLTRSLNEGLPQYPRSRVTF